jgi:hypothetical protein
MSSVNSGRIAYNGVLLLDLKKRQLPETAYEEEEVRKA